jgi:hypothetical protein
LLNIFGNVTGPKAKANKAPSDLGNQALEEQMVYCFIFKTKGQVGFPTQCLLVRLSLVKMALFSTSQINILIL